MKTQYKYEMTNACTCVDYDYDNDIEVPSDGCYGWCWDDALEDFSYATEDLRNANETGWWKVENLRLWHGNVSGYFPATKVSEIIRGMTVDNEWTLRYTVHDDRVEYSLSHHDAIGSASVLRPVSEEEQEEKGLY